MDRNSLPFDRGRRLLPTLIDELSISDPDRVFLSYPAGLRPKDGYRDVTFSDFAAAVNRCSWWLEDLLGHSEDFRTLRYFGAPDLRSTILLYSAVKTGHKLFLSSLSFNSVEEDLQLLEDLQCDIMLLPVEGEPLEAERVLSRRAMRTLRVPTLEDLLMTKGGPVYLYNKTYAQAENEPFVVLHSSGSTGRPKPVLLNHGTLAHHDLFPSAPLLGGKPLNIARFCGKRVLLNLPLFHSAGVCFLAFSIYSATIPVLLPSPMSAESVNEAHIHAGVDASFLMPSFLTEIVQNAHYFKNLERLEYITFGGSALSPGIGNKVKDLAHLFVSFGTTECGFYALEETDPEDWQYASFSPIMGCDLRPFSENLYEFFFVRSDQPQKSQGVFSTYPLLQEYSAKDLYSKHPSKEKLWLYEGRGDDIIVFSNGMLNIHPQEMEHILESHPGVKSAIVCGQGHPKVAVLIEAQLPPRTEQERSKFLEDIRPSIQLANAKTELGYKKITEDLILFTSADRPMVRAGKGSVLRGKTVELYASDLDQIFARRENSSSN